LDPQRTHSLILIHTCDRKSQCRKKRMKKLKTLPRPSHGGNPMELQIFIVVPCQQLYQSAELFVQKVFISMSK